MAPEPHVEKSAAVWEDAGVQNNRRDCPLDDKSPPINMPRDLLDIVIARRHRRKSVSHLPSCIEPRPRKSRTEPNAPVDDCRTIQELTKRVFKWLAENPAEEDVRLIENGSKLGSVKKFYRIR